MSEHKRLNLVAAVKDFRRARRRAALQDILAQFTGRSVNLISYEEASVALKAQGAVPRGLREIPLNAIVGSVGRYADFTRSFLPRDESDEERWVQVKVKASDQGGIRPIKVYQIGEAYFVFDGNHRVSVARQLGATHIQAYVVEVTTRVTLSPEDRPDDLIWKAEYTDFLESTHLDKLRPQADLSVSVPGQYRVLEEQILYHRRFMELVQSPVSPREITYEEAVADWYDTVYLPVAQVIRERRVLGDLPGRTETDLYIWISEHRAALEEELGWEVRPLEAAEHLVEYSSPRPKHVAVRVTEKILDSITPSWLRAGPAPGHWRQEHVAARHDDRLFGDILVAISGREEGWRALDQALEVAGYEEARVYGLYVVSTEEEREGEQAQAVRAEFTRRCQEAGIYGQMAVDVGRVANKISERSRWADLVVLSLSYPPPSRPFAKVESGVGSLLRNCPRPILTVPESCTVFQRALLAYDASPKAEEALFVAAYLAARWELPLAVVTVPGRHGASAAQEHAKRYLEQHGVHATFVAEPGRVDEIVCQVAEEQGSDLIVTGGYGRSPLMELVLGSAVDALLRGCKRPLLICR